MSRPVVLVPRTLIEYIRGVKAGHMERINIPGSYGVESYEINWTKVSHSCLWSAPISLSYLPSFDAIPGAVSCVHFSE